MADRRSLSPPLPPEPQAQAQTQTQPPAQHRKVQPFQEAFIAPPSTKAEQQAFSAPLDRAAPGRPRADSRAPPVQHVQPIKDAVHDAFDSPTVAQSELDPDLVQKITEQVIRSLQANLSAANVPPTAAGPTATAQQPQARYRSPPPLVTPVPTYAPTSDLHRSPLAQVHPPPPLSKQSSRDDVYYTSSSPELDPALSESGSSHSRHSRESRDSRHRSRAGRDYQGRASQVDGTNDEQDRRAAARRAQDYASEDDRTPRGGSAAEGMVKDGSKAARRASSDASRTYHSTTSQSRARPPRIPSEVHETPTTIEKIWQPLFESGKPTTRLGQFLRGLALHLIEDYEPKNSLVVTPAKLLRFFSETKLEDENYPWDTIFGGRMTNAHLSTMYRKLQCQHHLVQTHNQELPSVPALTPGGFETLMIYLIQAHPDSEYDRLNKAVMDMPISNAEDRQERFPKSLSRRLLPSQANLQAEQRLVASLDHEPLVQLKRPINIPGPPPPQASAPRQQTSFPERERNPYSSTSFSSAIDDDELIASSVQIERERQPYSAKEGTGKTYDDHQDRERDRERGSKRERRPSTSHHRPEPVPSNRATRAASNTPTPVSYVNNAASAEPVNVPAPSRHRLSFSQQPGPPPSMFNNVGGNAAGRRTPPPRNPYARSEPADIHTIPPSQYTSNSSTGYPNSSTIREPYRNIGDPDEESGRRHHTRRPTGNGGSTEDDSSSGRGYPIPPRPPPSSQGYDSSNPPPVGSYPRGGMAGSYDGRRATWYGTGAPNAGSDGYGSFMGTGSGYTPNQPYGSSTQH